MVTQPVRRALLAVDVERSGDLNRNNQAWLGLRRALAKAMATAFAESGIDLGRCQVQDTGDGRTVAIPDTVPRERLVHPLLVTLARELLHHNQRADPSARIRVRVAVHDADVPIDDQGLATGPQFVLLNRLLDCAAVRDTLARAPETATVVAIVSDRFHGAVVLHGYPGIDAEAFRPVEVRHKETVGKGWITVPGHTEPPAPRGGRRLAAAIIGAAVVVALVAAGVIWLTGGTPPSTSDSPSASGDCLGRYFEQEPRVPYPVVYDLTQDVPARQLNAGTARHPSGGVLRHDRAAVGATRFSYEHGVFTVLDVVDASCHPVPATTRQVAADSYVVSFRLGDANRELAVTVAMVTVDVTFRSA